VKVPAVANKSFEELSKKPEFMVIVQFIIDKLSKIPFSIKRAKVIHQTIDEFNNEVFSHPLVKQFSPCKSGCSACCHTQVSVTRDEAELLVQRIADGVEINIGHLILQAQAGDNASDFYKLDYKERACIFLDENGACKVYNDRPSVCRTNAVLGEASQCMTNDGHQQVRLVKTPQSDMVIYASFLYAQESGSLPSMVYKVLDQINNEVKES
jgi:Fe-S-cluster containining protein